MTLYAAGEGKPAQLAQAKTNDDGDFKLDVGAEQLKGASDKVLYLVARGGTPKAEGAKGPNDALALLSVLGTKLPKSATVNELTTASNFAYQPTAPGRGMQTQDQQQTEYLRQIANAVGGQWRPPSR